MIKITYKDTTTEFTNKDINDMYVYDYIVSVLEEQGVSQEEIHEIAAEVQGWTELAVFDEEYDLSEYAIIAECTED